MLFGGARLGDSSWKQAYTDGTVFEQRWRDTISRAGGREAAVGLSVEGRPLWRFDLGLRDAAAPTILLTALVHGVEVIGSVALLEAVSAVVARNDSLLDRARLVLMPIVNPDALAANMDRLKTGRRAYQRCNARGVDLNRNFPPVQRQGSSKSASRAGLARWHPMAGSSWRLSPYFRGPHPLSEPESRAVRDVAVETTPRLSLGFHSFGDLLLYPWAHSRQPNPRAAHYARLARVFLNGMPHATYRFRQAIDWYPIVGDLDDWLDTQFATAALTVEVSHLDRRLFHPRALNPFWWMNPTDVGAAVSAVAPGVIALLATGV
ncbi:MAG: succinylglutamate desuccinylase/aspartoacylase family protein [Deltaproteobacteria bacterium]|nr:succinylglutamate desuccinylase/aspartoacylase family protein [Deltaproteobacteria bacterium]